jgi:hypothetical protein
MPSRHERRKATVAEVKQLTPEQFHSMGSMCAWKGCPETFPGDMPRGWTYLLAYWAPRPGLDVTPLMTGKDFMRDAALCPMHTRELDRLLKATGRELSGAMAGSA